MRESQVVGELVDNCSPVISAVSYIRIDIIDSPFSYTFEEAKATFSNYEVRIPYVVSTYPTCSFQIDILYVVLGAQVYGSGTVTWIDT